MLLCIISWGTWPEQLLGDVARSPPGGKRGGGVGRDIYIYIYIYIYLFMCVYIYIYTHYDLI